MYIHRRKARYHETDQMGVINHANYISWMEDARVDFMRDFGFGYKKMEELGVMSPVVGITIDYKRPVRFDDDVEIRLAVARYSGTVLEIKYEFHDLTSGELCTTAVSKHCFLKDGRVISLKRDLPEFDAIMRAQFDADAALS